MAALAPLAQGALTTKSIAKGSGREGEREREGKQESQDRNFASFNKACSYSEAIKCRLFETMVADKCRCAVAANSKALILASV